MSDPGKAVFLSYASQDAEAAKRICDAMRSGGVEVWFDADGGLEQGDEWDAKIRKQIKECVLFVPIISANTQSRLEGYFRIEWDLAAERARGIASGVPFILPVVIDDTREPDAFVPDRFRMVQWTRLPGGELQPEVLQRFLKLWSHRTGVLKHQNKEQAEGNTGGAISRPSAISRTRLIGFSLLGLIVALVCAWLLLRPRASVPQPTESARGVDSEAMRLVEQARSIIYDPDSGRNEFALAEDLLKRATDLAPDSGAAWGTSALLNHYFYSRSYDRDRERLVRSQAAAEKALRLDTRSTDALLAMGLHRQLLGEKERAQVYLDQARAMEPQNPKVILAQSLQISDSTARAHYLLDAAPGVSRPAELYYYASNDLQWDWRFEEAKDACERAIAAQPFWRAFVSRAGLEYNMTADPVQINRWLDQVPELKRDEPRVAVMRYLAAMLRRDGQAAVRALQGIAVDYLEDNYFTGPKAFLLAQAYELSSQPGLAAEQWLLVERAARDKLLSDPGGIRFRSMLAISLAAQHRENEARQVADACAVDERLRQNTPAIENTTGAYLRMGDPARAIDLLRLIPNSKTHLGNVFVSTLAVDPQWDALRSQPNYPQLIADLKRAEKQRAREAAKSDPTPHDAKSVAVLAFANLSDDKDNEYFSDGISEELLNVLAKVPGLKVTARTSSFFFKGKQVPIADIAQQLGVAYVVEGSVRKAGDRVRISAQLIKAGDGFNVWSDSFDRDLKDVFAVQDEIAGLIASNLSLRMGVGSSASQTVNPAAFQLYLQGRQSWRSRTSEGFVRAERQFNQALAIDPKFARAYVGLADVWFSQSESANAVGAFDQRESPTLAKIEAAVQKALDLNSDLAEAHATLGGVRWLQWRFEDGIRELRRAVTLNPSYISGHQWLGRVYMSNGQMEEVLEQLKFAHELDPLYARVADNYAQALIAAQRPQEALAAIDQALAVQPDSNQALRIKAIALVDLGRNDEAITTARLYLDRGADVGINSVAYALARAGARTEAARILADTDRSKVDSSWLAASQVLDEAEVFNQDIAVGGIKAQGLEFFYFLPVFDAVRNKPAFVQMLQTLGISEAEARAQAWRAAHPPEKPEAKP